jgi:hypothetical protein
VTDRRPVLLLRRSFPGRPHDLRWLDDDRLLLTASDGERTAVHVVTVAESRVRTMHLARRYLAPPEIAEARLLGIGKAE